MALSAAEEALVRELIAQNPELLSLAGNEATIISKLGATKKNLSQLAAAMSLNDTDLAFVRQGSSDKSVALSVLKAFAVSSITAASETVSGIAELATTAEATAGTDDLRIMTPLKTKQSIQTFAPPETVASTAESQAGTNNTNFITPLRMREGFNASGSAPVYACRAWVNFNGTGTVAIRASGNVSSITDNGVGDYTVNFTTAMPDANYSVGGYISSPGAASNGFGLSGRTALPAAGSIRINTELVGAGLSAADFTSVSIQVFR